MVYWILGLIIIGLIIIICFIAAKKIKDTFQLKLEVETLQYQKNDLENDIATQKILIDEYNNKLLEVKDKYNQEIQKKTDDLNQYFENQKRLRQEDLDLNFDKLWEEKEKAFNIRYAQAEQEELEKERKFKQEVQNNIDAARKSQENIIADTQFQQERYESLLEPLKKYEMEQQAKLFYTIQVPDEYKEDINFLITTVSQKVQHPDIINKLVWAEYVRPYIEQTFKRVEIEDKSGIYKLTNIDSGKCYIGKSTNIKKRIIDHFKSSIGIKTIADQAVHHEIWKTGFWNWMIEAICYCDKEKLNEMEKYYINFFKSNTFGYNKTGGGEG